MADIGVIVLTGKDLTPSERSFLQAEADQVLTKGGTTFRELAEHLRSMAPAKQPEPVTPG